MYRYTYHLPVMLVRYASVAAYLKLQLSINCSLKIRAAPLKKRKLENLIAGTRNISIIKRAEGCGEHTVVTPATTHVNGSRQG